jgi:hypothetical protein
LRAIVLTAAIVPFLIYAYRDTVYHLRDRKPTLAENLVHLALGACQLAMILGAYQSDPRRVALAASGVACFGIVDEHGFHHGLPASESDIHAKAHFALFVFLAVAVALGSFSSLDAFIAWVKQATPR